MARKGVCIKCEILFKFNKDVKLNRCYCDECGEGLSPMRRLKKPYKGRMLMEESCLSKLIRNCRI